MAKIILSLVLFIFFYGEIASQSNDLTRLTSLYEKLTSHNFSTVEQRNKTAEAAIKLARETNNQTVLAKCLIYMGRIANRERDGKNSFKYLTEARSICKNIHQLELEAETEIMLSEHYRLLRDKPDSAFHSAKRAYSIGRSLNDTSIIKRSGYNLVASYTSLHDPVHAIRTADETLKFCEGDKAALSDIYNQLVIVYRDAGDLRESIRYQELSLEIADQSNHYFAMASIRNNIANSKAQLREFESAVGYHKGALEIYNKMNDFFGIAYTYNMMGTTYLLAKRNQEAVNCFNEAINRFTKIGSRQQLAFAQSNLATVHLNMDQLDKAEIFIQAAVKNSELINDKLAMQDAYSTAGTYYRKRKMINRSIYYLKKAEQCAKEINNPLILQSIYEQLSDSYDEKGDAKNALSFLQLKNAITDTIARQNAQRAYIEMLVKYETGKIRKEVSDTKGKLDQLKKESRRKTIFFITIIVVSVTVISLLAFFYWKKISSLFYRYSYLSRKPFNDARNVKAVLSVINKEIPEATHIDKDTSAHLVTKLKMVMLEQKLFLKTDLTLSDLAKFLQTNTSYLSRVINDEYGMNFSNFVNKYRIEEAQRLIKSHKQDVLTFEGIAKSCGFLSRSSFNQAFKKFTGMTPTEYSQNIYSKKELNN